MLLLGPAKLNIVLVKLLDRKVVFDMVKEGYESL